MLLRKEEVVMFSWEVMRNACWRYRRGSGGLSAALKVGQKAKGL